MVFACYDLSGVFQESFRERRPVSGQPRKLNRLESPAAVACFQEALAERVKLYRAWKDNEANLTKKRELKSRLELTHKTDKLNEANREIAEVEILAAAVVVVLYFKQLPISLLMTLAFCVRVFSKHSSVKSRYCRPCVEHQSTLLAVNVSSQPCLLFTCSM